MESKILFMGIDCGQTAVKISLFNIDGNEICAENIPTKTSSSGLFFTLDTSSLWRDICSAIRTISSSCSGRIASVAVSGHGNGLYMTCEENSFPTAVLSTDRRAEKITSDWKKNGTAAKIRKITLCEPWAGQPAPILNHLKNNNSDFFSRITSVLSCSDWISYKLSSVLSSDIGGLATSGLINQHTGKKDPVLYKLYGVEELDELIPPIKKYGDLIGNITPAAASETGLDIGTAVGCGSFDVNACCIGSGMPSENCYAVTAGTWSINTAFTDSPIISDELFSCNLFGDGKRFSCIESSPTSAVNLEVFLRQNSSLTPRKCDVIVENTRYISDTECLYLPYVNPIPSMPWLKGGFTPKAMLLTQNEQIRLLFEGVAMGHLHHIENLRKAGIIREKVRMSGGATRSDVWMQIFSDTLGLPLEISESVSSGALGAALSGAIAAGYIDSIDTAGKKCTKIRKTVYPDADMHRRCLEKYAAFENNIKLQRQLSERNEIYNELCYS